MSEQQQSSKIHAFLASLSCENDLNKLKENLEELNKILFNVCNVFDSVKHENNDYKDLLEYECGEFIGTNGDGLRKVAADCARVHRLSKSLGPDCQREMADLLIELFHRLVLIRRDECRALFTNNLNDDSAWILEILADEFDFVDKKYELLSVMCFVSKYKRLCSRESELRDHVRIYLKKTEKNVTQLNQYELLNHIIYLNVFSNYSAINDLDVLAVIDRVFSRFAMKLNDVKNKVLNNSFENLDETVYPRLKYIVALLNEQVHREKFVEKIEQVFQLKSSRFQYPKDLINSLLTNAAAYNANYDVSQDWFLQQQTRKFNSDESANLELRLAIFIFYIYLSYFVLKFSQIDYQTTVEDLKTHFYDSDECMNQLKKMLRLLFYVTKDFTLVYLLALSLNLQTSEEDYLNFIKKIGLYPNLNVVSELYQIKADVATLEQEAAKQLTATTDDVDDERHLMIIIQLTERAKFDKFQMKQQQQNFDWNQLLLSTDEKKTFRHFEILERLSSSIENTKSEDDQQIIKTRIFMTNCLIYQLDSAIFYILKQETFNKSLLSSDNLVKLNHLMSNERLIRVIGVPEHFMLKKLNAFLQNKLQ